jgi:uncharacterized protein with PIN domain/tRNA(Ser,Leu) C12 N-acetylase TAN1
VGSPFIYLVRFAESGRDAQPERQGLRRDLAEVLAAALPGARIETASGRLIVESQRDAEDVLADLPGIATFSPCRRVARDELVAAALELAAEALPEGGTFCVRAKRVGDERGRSRELAVEVGRAIAAGVAGLTVDLRNPDAVIGVEARDGGDFYLFHRVVPGLDRQPPVAAPTRAGGEPRFLVDQMLGRLAVWLRLLGFDTAQPLDRPDSWLLRLARQEDRILLTQDAPLARVTSVRIHYVQARSFEEQLAEVVRLFDLPVDPARLLTRCSRCNSRVDRLAAEAARLLVPPAVRDAHEDFFACPSCRKVYWRGDHCERILDRLAGMRLG